MSFLYIGTFGSFIGYSAAFPLLIKTSSRTSTSPRYAFLGALVGSLARPFGGGCRTGSAAPGSPRSRFVVMALGVLRRVWRSRCTSFAVFLAAFLLLFAATGIGNGSTYRMIPAIFQAKTVDGADGSPAGSRRTRPPRRPRRRSGSSPRSARSAAS